MSGHGSARANQRPRLTTNTSMWLNFEEWEDLFEYIQAKGIVLHFVFEDDSGWTGIQSRYVLP